MAENTIIRELGPDDLEAFSRVRLHGLVHHPRSFWETTEEFQSKPAEEHLKTLREISTDEGKFMLGAFTDDELVGIVGFSRDTGLKGRHRGMIWGMYVLDSHQGKGLGRKLMDAAITRAKQIPEMEVLFLFVAPENAPARRLYTGVGFKTYGIEPYSMKFDGKFYDEEMMYLKLN